MSIQEESIREYRIRINRVTDHIYTHLDEPADLSVLAGIAHFSPFHFHRIFTAMTGETPNVYLNRLRVEKAARLLRKQHQMSVSEIAALCGFGSDSSFSRSFRKAFGMSPGKFRRTEEPAFALNGRRYSKNGKLVGKDGQEIKDADAHLCSVEQSKFIIMDTKVEIREQPEMKVVYMRYTGPFDQVKKVYGKMFWWAGSHGLLGEGKEVKMLTMYHDDPSVTDIDKVRQDVCLVVDEDIPVSGEVSKGVVPGGKYMVGHFEITENQFEEAWNTMCHAMAESGCQPDDGAPYEIYHNDHTGHPEKKFILDICLPVKPL